MDLAFHQANKIRGNTGQNPAVGCALVKNNILIGLAHTRFNGSPHAENLLLNKNDINLKNSTLYTTLEPCSHFGKNPPCTDIISKRKIKKVYFSSLDPDKRSFNKSKSILFKKGIKVYRNINKLKSDIFYKDFKLKQSTNKIFISSKLATSKDFFSKNKNNLWITNIYSRKRVHLIRSIHDCILSTSKTILNDNSLLNCRIDGLEKFSPTRFLLDKSLDISLKSNIAKTANTIKTYLFYNFEHKVKIKKLKQLNIKTVKIGLYKGHLDFEKIIFFIKSKGFHRLLIESGIEFNNFLLDNNYINEFYHFYSNDIFGKKGLYNTKKFLKKLNRLKKSKKRIKVNLFGDRLNKYMF